MKVTKPRVVSLVKKWRAILGIEPEWLINVRVHQHHYEADEGYGDAVAYIEADESTWEAPLAVNAYNVGKKYPLEDTIVHELIHVLNAKQERALRGLFTGALKKFGLAMVEANTERLARAFMRARKK